MNQEDLSYYSQTIKEGIGLGRIMLGKSTSRDVLFTVGHKYEILKHHQHSCEIHCQEHGTSFYYRPDDPKERIFLIIVQQPYSGTASAGIKIGKHTLQDVVDEYGPPTWTTTNNSDTWWSNYPGIEFHVKRERSLPQYPLDEALHLKRTISKIVIKERIPGILNPSVQALLPRVFVSYRWDNPEHVNWVWLFVQDLLRRKVDVIYDRYDYLAHSPRPDHIGLAVLVQRMAGCHTFIPILTPKYMERIPNYSGPAALFGTTQTIEDGWVFDEFQQFLLQNKVRGQMPCAAIVREGELEDFIPMYGKITDLRDSAKHKYAFDYHQTLDALASIIHQYAATHPLRGANDCLSALDRYFEY